MRTPRGSLILVATIVVCGLFIGAAYKRGKRTIYYGTVPKRCPKGGFPAKLELTFASGETVTTMYKAPCPKH